VSFSSLDLIYIHVHIIGDVIHSNRNTFLLAEIGHDPKADNIGARKFHLHARACHAHHPPDRNNFEPVTNAEKRALFKYVFIN